MSIFAGVFARNPSKNIPAGLIEELRSAMSRHPDDAGKVQEFSEDKVFLAKLDLGALNATGEFFAPGLVALVAGDPLFQLSSNDSPLPRAKSLEILARDVIENNHQRLRTCRGTYCAVAYDQVGQQLHLITDRLGIRPVYCWILPEFVIFSTALRILEKISVFEKTMDVQGVAEIACYGCPLADRTPYRDIFCLLAGEVIRFDCTGTVQRSQYWRWDDLPPAEVSEVPAAQHIYQKFQEAIKLRLRNDKVSAAHLSGGLDSRAIVAALRAADIKVLTVNFSPLNSQDQVLGQMAADRLGTHHTFMPIKPLMDGDRHSNASVRDWMNSPEYLSNQPCRPQVIWSGDGGSECLGHVFLNAETIAAAREERLESAMEIFMAYNGWGFSTKLLKKNIGLNLTYLARKGFFNELKNLKPTDGGRIFHLFVLLNDQRRHMFNHFENSDLKRIELEMPFFDADFLTAIVREKIDPFLRHGFYLSWLKLFPPGVMETPWQAYPNHEPCMHPLPKNLSSQWSKECKKIKEQILMYY